MLKERKNNMSETKILVPYDEYTAMVKDSADLESITGLLHTDFPDNTSQILAIKSVLGMVPEKSEPITENPVENKEIKTEPEEGTV